MTPRIAGSALLGVAGVAVIEAPAVASLVSGEDAGLSSPGAPWCSSLRSSRPTPTCTTRSTSRPCPPAWNVWLQTLAGSALLLALAAGFERGAALRWTPSSAGALVYLAILGTALPFAGLFWLLHRVPVSVIGTIPVVDTVIAVVLGNLVLGEKFTPRVLAGAALILVAVLLASAPARRPASIARAG